MSRNKNLRSSEDSNMIIHSGSELQCAQLFAVQAQFHRGGVDLYHLLDCIACSVTGCIGIHNIKFCENLAKYAVDLIKG